MPSRLPARRDPTRILEPGHRRSADHTGPSRKGAAALAPLYPTGYHQARSVRSNPSRLRVAGCRLQVRSLFGLPALLFAICDSLALRRGHELWSNRIRNRLLQDTIDFNIVLGGQLPSVSFLHTLQLFG